MGLDRDTLRLNGQDDSVEVNQRALIEKVLARYSGEFTVFRELLQNSDDAQASAVEIRFETAEYLRRKEHALDQGKARPLLDLKTTHVVQWTFRNNGFTFRKEDWSRLRRIAEGNPDEEKIGAFGVGFYSLFSVTESPLVSSGGYGMEFYWKKNKEQLQIRCGNLPSKGAADTWTTFEMVLREAGPIPPAFDLMRFLASSITFMTHLDDVSVYFDEHRIGHIKRSPGAAKAVDLPITLKQSSGSEIMSVKAVRSHAIKIEAEVMHAVYAVGTAKGPLQEVSPPRKPKPDTPVLSPATKRPMELHKTNVTLTAFTAEVDVKLEEKLSAEFFRSTKKKPPARLEYYLIYTGKKEYDQSLADEESQPTTCGSIFQGLRADLNGAIHTRIFIGHATRQTTGIGGHMASYFIPTVERESMDFMDKNIAVWNKELLYVGGLLSRAAYELELSTIDVVWVNAARGTLSSRPPQDLQTRLQDQFVHTLKFFAFHRSIPSEEVGQLLESAFYGCTSAPLRILSSIGVRRASDVKQYDPIFAEFLQGVPMLTDSLIHGCGRALVKLRDQGVVSPITFLDIQHDLHVHQLNKEKLVSFLRWWIGMKQENSEYNMARLLDAAVYHDDSGRKLPLSSVQRFVDPGTLGIHIPQGGPLPSFLLPQDIAKHFIFAELSGFGWQEFTVVDWLHHISQNDLMSKDDWTVRVLRALSRLWSSLSNGTRSEIKDIFTNRTWIPTSCGPHSPNGSYLPGTSIGLFRDLKLPVVQFPDGSKITGEVEALLSFIGVRKHVDPKLILERMQQAKTWDVTGLISYLGQVRKSLTPEELAHLGDSEIFTESTSKNNNSRYCAHQLYAPYETFRRLQLPLIQWGEESEWSDDSDEAKLLFRLGLRRYPPVEDIVSLCSSEVAAVRTPAFRFLCDNLASTYPNYHPRQFEHIAFIPAENKNGKHLGRLGDVFLDERWKVLDLSVVQDNYRNAAAAELGVLEHPPIPKLLSHLKDTRPPDEAAAEEWFEILFERISAFESHELVMLSKLPIIPTRNSGVREWLSPTQCYLGEGTQDSLHSKLFVFVTFGDFAKRFLSACGSRNEPTVMDVAQSLVDNPERFETLAGSHENFLAQLRNLAVNKHRIPNMTLSKMKFGPILLGKKAMGRQGGWNIHERRSPKEIVIADDINAYPLFRDAIFVAPQEELLEDFYASLGCKRLSEVVQEQCDIVGDILDPEACLKLRNLVLERLTLFLHEFTYAKPKFTIDWLRKPENFRVKICESLSISKVLIIGDKKVERPQRASAGAKRDNQGCIELWFSSAALAEPDMYEVSTSFCRLLFGTAKVSESLLFTMILSTDLDALRRRGCNVDQILRRHRLEQDEPKMDSEAEVIMEGEVSESSSSPEPSSGLASQATQDRVAELDASTPSPSQNIPQPSQVPRIHVPELGTPVPSTSLDPPEPAPPFQSSITEKEASAPVPCHGISQASSHCSLPTGCEVEQRPPPTCKHKPKSTGSGIIGVIRKRFFRRRTSGTHVTTGQPHEPMLTQQFVMSLGSIRTSVNKAIEGCKSGGGPVVDHLSGMEEVKEFLTDRYCDVSGQLGKLEHLGELSVGNSFPGGKRGSVRVYVTKDVQKRNIFMKSKEESLNRFADIIVSIAAQAYALPTTSLNIFYDVGGGTVAFNQRGNLYFNLRFFEEWHDQDVAGGDKQSAQISWFFTLAHEIAHNLVQSHNSEHAFWFSAICEAGISRLKHILGPTADC